jgi:hypothetical protein
MAKVTLLTGSIVGFSYATEFFARGQRQPLREGDVLQPRDRPVRVGVLDDGVVQRAGAAVLWSAGCARASRAVRAVDPRQRRHVARDGSSSS